MNLEELLRKYVIVAGQKENEHLAFRKISPKKNREDYLKLKEIIQKAH